jgi:PEP-CTERM motif
MNAISLTFERAALAGACWLALAWAPAAQAAPVDIPFEGAGNAVIFDPLAGTGGWVGSLDEVLAPGQSGPARSFVSVVTFSFDALANLLSGQFEFTDALDLSTSLFGTVAGAFTTPTSTLAGGGQFALDYTVAGGTGGFQGTRGFGLSFLTYDPVATTFNNYTEQGLLVLNVPEPATLPLVAGGMGLLALALRRRLPAAHLGA